MAKPTFTPGGIEEQAIRYTNECALVHLAFSLQVAKKREKKYGDRLNLAYCVGSSATGAEIAFLERMHNAAVRSIERLKKRIAKRKGGK